MGNRSRRQRARTHGPKPHISRQDQIRTVALYIRLESSRRVGEELGISAAAVRDRLYALGVELRPQGSPAHDGRARARAKHNLRVLQGLYDRIPGTGQDGC